MTKMTRIAVLSDLHIGPNCKARELCEPVNDRAPKTNFIEHFDALCEQSDLNADYLLIAGDISETARPAEFIKASEVIEKVATALNVNEDHIIFVPGNHDKDWLPLKGDPEDESGVRILQGYYPLSQTNTIFRKVVDGGKVGLVNDSRWSLWNDRKLMLVGYNSSWYDKPTDQPHYGKFDEGDYDAIVSNVPSRVEDDQLRLLLVHHHPFYFTDRIPVPDFSTMVNADRLMELCSAIEIDLLIHGHKHIPRFEMRLADTTHYMGILCAGSFCKSIQPPVSEKVLNQFHIIEYSGRDTITNCALGEVLSWSHLNDTGWERSEAKSAGIEHRNPFGKFAHITEIVSDLQEYVDTHQDERYIEWEDVLKRYPSMKYLPKKTIARAIAKLHDSGIIKECVPRGEDSYVILLKR